MENNEEINNIEPVVDEREDLHLKDGKEVIWDFSFDLEKVFIERMENYMNHTTAEYHCQDDIINAALAEFFERRSKMEKPTEEIHRKER